MNLVTANLSEFGRRELRMAADLLDALCQQGLPEDMEDGGVSISFNTQSGYVFLTNTDYQVAMLHDGKLERFESCPVCGEEGFKAEVAEHGKDNADCQEWLQDIGAGRS